ncbi:hypothetical protein [Jatrophihabitans lederbergiae]|uniref:Preprotein translocase subunit SecB n=1 Tax=Jatrophihabitans lederbergiae TaxID=3075547 RepID=A0ABU2JDY0_9ACTN|nr:hypothetical protein [Jatrophihabitans sp. DSM 44399]MDT0263180.1 hypothetical protein [Jatrophihabitans sp. DSM 44399]
MTSAQEQTHADSIEDAEDGSVHEPAASGDTVDPGTYNDFVTSVALTAINVVGIGGERRAAGEATQTRFDLGAAYQVETDAVHYRFDATGQLTDEAGTDYGQVSASVVLTLTLTAPAPPPPCIERFGSMTATMVVHPYLREALASTALRLGFGGVLLPLITQPSEHIKRGG